MYDFDGPSRGGKPRRCPLPEDAGRWVFYTPPAMTEREAEWFHGFPYRSIIGSLLYLCLHTRPDIMFAVCLLARFCNEPSYGACYCAAWLLSYLSGTKGDGIHYNSPSAADFHAFVDADWAGDVAGRRSTSGYVVYMCGGPLAWGSKLMKTIATSTMQAEFMGYYYCITTMLYITHVIKEVGLEMFRQVVLFTDAEAAMRAAYKGEPNQLSKHFETQLWWVCSFIGVGPKAFIHLEKTPSRMNVADVLTKPMTVAQCLEHFPHLLGLLPRSAEDVMIASIAGFWPEETMGMQMAESPEEKQDIPSWSADRRTSSSRGGDSESA